MQATEKNYRQFFFSWFSALPWYAGRCLLVMLMGVINIMLNVLAGARWWPGDRTIVAAPYHGRSDGRLCRLGKTGLASSCVVITSHRPVLRPPEPQGPFTAAEVDHIEGKRTRINEKSREEKARRAFFKQICLSACFKQSVNAYKILSKRTVFIATTLYVPAL